jgi:pyruvate,water dikinase
MAAAPKLLTNIPLPIRLLFIDSEFSHLNLEKEVSDENIPSAPMKAFWSGVKHVGWPHPPAMDMKGFASVLTTSISTGAAERSSFSENSFALLSKEYMNFSIRMGYHYSTIEALCSDIPNKNYIRMKFQEGGASIDRRRRRIKLIINILKEIGFENFSKRDFLDSSVSHSSKEDILNKLKWLGALSIHTKQLDMTLSNDQIAGWYEEDILKKLRDMT